MTTLDKKQLNEQMIRTRNLEIIDALKQYFEYRPFNFELGLELILGKIDTSRHSNETLELIKKRL